MKGSGIQWTLVILFAAGLSSAAPGADSIWIKDGTERALTHEEGYYVAKWINKMRSEVTPTASDLPRVVSLK